MIYKIIPLPFAPNEYEAQYFNEIIRSLNLYFRSTTTPSHMVQDALTLLNLPNSATGLSPGSIWHDTTDNTLKIVPVSANSIVKLVGINTVAINGNISI